MTSDLTWSKEDTHCAWCGKELGDPAHEQVSAASCPEIERQGGGLIGRMQMASIMRAEIEVLRGIVQRVQNGWWAHEGWPGSEDPDDTDGLWIGPDGSDEMALIEPMTEAEQIAWYGSVVRKEETDGE